MNPSRSESNDVIYLNEINAAKPVTPTNMDSIPSIRPRAGSLSETVSNMNRPRPTVESETEDLQPAGKAMNNFGSMSMDDGLLPERPMSPSWRNSRDLLSSQEPVQATPDVNVYQHKKTLAQGMMDLALLSANANQMRYVLQTDGRHPYFYPSLTMISMSLFLQIAVGIGLIWNSRYNVKEHEQMCKANRLNNWTVIGIFLVTILNVFISSFGVVDHTQITNAVTS